MLLRTVAVAALAFGLGPSAAHAPAMPAHYRSDAAVLLPETVPVVVPFSFEHLPKAWRKLAMCESSGRPAVRGGKRGQYRGLFQIEYPRTWVAHGGPVNEPPSAANVPLQWAVALHIFADRGSKPWPHCGKYLREVYGR